MVESGRISKSFNLLCMSSLPGNLLAIFVQKMKVEILDFFLNKTRTVRGSDYSPAIELSEQKDNLVTATGDTEKYSEKQANKVWLNSVYWFSRY